MSCNYYIHTRDIDMIFDLGKRVYPIHSKRVFECHIAQTCGNLKPLFESHSYTTFKELKSILLNKKYDFEIVDEYGRTISPKDFINYMERDNTNGKTRFEMPINNEGYQFFDKDFS